MEDEILQDHLKRVETTNDVISCNHLLIVKFATVH